MAARKEKTPNFQLVQKPSLIFNFFTHYTSKSSTRLKVELEAGAELVAATGEVGRVKLAAHGELGRVHKRRGVRHRESTIIGQLEAVRRAAAALALASDGERRAGRAVRAASRHGEFVVHLVVANGVKVVVAAGLERAVHAALGPVEGELLAGEVHLADVEAELGANVQVLGVHNGVNVELVRAVAVDVQVRLGVAPVELERAHVGHRHAVHRGTEAGGDLGGVLFVLGLTRDRVLARSERLLDGETGDARHGHLDLVAARDGAILERALGGELEAVALGRELSLVVLVLEALVEEVVTLLGQISVLGRHV
jgi:hypothetical protein